MTYKFGTTYENVSVYNTVTNIEEELDFASIVIPFSTRKARYQPFTLVEIDLDTVVEYWFVNSDTTKAVDHNERTKHRHEMTLIELTKILERYPMPNRAFTKTGQTGLEIVQNIIDTVPFDDTYNYDGTRVIDGLSTALITELDIPFPEIYLSERTMLEAFIELFKVIRAFPRLTYVNGEWILSADFYNDLIEEIDKESGIANRIEKQDISKYATNFVISGSNQLDPGVFITEPSPTGWLTSRGDGGLLDIESSFIQVQYPIDMIEQVTIQFTYDSIIYTVDATDYVVDKEVKQGLNTVGGETDSNSNSILDVYEDIWQDNTLYYSRNSNRIEGLYDLYQPDLTGGNEKYAIVLLLRTLFYNETGTTPVSLFDTAAEIATIPTDVKFRIKYSSKISARQEVERQDLTEFSTRSTLIKGQSDKFLSSKKMLSNALSELNRSGSTSIKTSVQNVDLGDIHAIGTYTDDGYILTNVERIKYNDHYDVNYTWTKDFQRVSEYLSLDNQPRLYEIGDSLVRNEVFKQYIIMDTVSAENDSYLEDTAFSTFINTLRPTPLSAYNKPITSTVFQSADMSIDCVLRPVTAYGGANTLNFHFGFTSPLSAGIRVVETDTHKQNEVVKYTNDLYELEDFNCLYVNDLSVVSENLPIVEIPTEYLINARGFKYKKDKSDILALTYQIIVTAQQGLDAFVGDKFIDTNNLIKELDSYESLIVYVSDIPYNANDLSKVIGATTSLTYSYDATNRYIHLDTATSYRSWALGNENRDLYFAVNQQLDDLGNIIDTRTIYFNARNDRQDSTYQAPVPEPINLDTTAGSDAIFFDWDDGGTSDLFNVKITSGGITVANAYTTDTFYNFTDLDSDTEYVLSVRARANTEWSSFASIIESTTLGAPAAPSWISTNVVNSTTIDVEWEQVVGEEYYQVAWSTDGTNWYETQTTGTNDTTYTYSTLSSSTTYYFRVRAGNSTYGDSAWFDNYPEDPSTTPAPSPTSSPTINYVGQTEEYIIVTFTNNDTREVTIYFESDDATPDARTVVVSGSSTSGNQVIYDEVGSHTLYAYAQASGADPSSTVSYPFTLTATTSPDIPLNFQVIDVLLDEIYFQWTDNSTNEDGFTVELHTNSSFTNLYKTQNANANAQSMMMASVASGTYYARIKAYNGIGDSAWLSCSDNPITVI